MAASPNDVTGARREALICVSLGGVGRTKGADGSEAWRISRATGVRPPSEADLAWLRANGLIDIHWMSESSGAARVTQAGVEALRATGQR